MVKKNKIILYPLLLLLSFLVSGAPGAYHKGSVLKLKPNFYQCLCPFIPYSIENELKKQIGKVYQTKRRDVVVERNDDDIYMVTIQQKKTGDKIDGDAPISDLTLQITIGDIKCCNTEAIVKEVDVDPKKDEQQEGLNGSLEDFEVIKLEEGAYEK